MAKKSKKKDLPASSLYKKRKARKKSQEASLDPRDRKMSEGAKIKRWFHGGYGAYNLDSPDAPYRPGPSLDNLRRNREYYKKLPLKQDVHGPVPKSPLEQNIQGPISRKSDGGQVKKSKKTKAKSKAFNGNDFVTQVNNYKEM
jgi:hypothetical protein